jgi:hypothetical protein
LDIGYTSQISVYSMSKEKFQAKLIDL